MTQTTTSGRPASARDQAADSAEADREFLVEENS